MLALVAELAHPDVLCGRRRRPVRHAGAERGATTGARGPRQSRRRCQKTRYSEAANLKPLPPIVTNLAEPEGHVDPDRGVGRLRSPTPSAASNALACAIAEDIVAYLRTVPLAQIEGPSGFLHLREDLNDRARIRSGGKVRELVIQALVLE